MVVGGGEVIVPRAGSPRWTLSRWVDDATVLGVAIDGPGEGDSIGADDSLALMTCEIPSGRCTPVEETSGQVVRLPLGTRPADTIDLRARSES